MCINLKDGKTSGGSIDQFPFDKTKLPHRISHFSLTREMQKEISDDYRHQADSMGLKLFDEYKGLVSINESYRLAFDAFHDS